MTSDAPAIVQSTPLIALDAVVIDTETTGLDARTARLLQIGAVKVVGGRLDQESRYETLINPGVEIPPANTAVHGIDNAVVKGAPVFADVLPRLEELIAGTVLVGHTISYDVAVLERETELAGTAWRRPRALDVRLLARVVSPTLARYDLDRLCAWLGVKNTARHTALADAIATAEVFVALIPMLREKGVRTLGEAEAASRLAAEKEVAELGGRVLEGAQAADSAPVLQRIDSFPYRHRVRDVMSAPPIIVPGSTPVGDAVRLLIERKVSSVFVEAPHGGPGIVTERDLLRAIGREGPGALALPVESQMKAPLVTVGEQDFVYRAIGRIERHGIRHLAVVDGTGKLVGAVTTRNLLRHRATTAIVLGDEIEMAPDAAALAAAWAKLAPMARSLVDEAVDPRVIAAVISAEVCSITARAAELAVSRMKATGRGDPPTPYAVLVLGSAGRGESLLAADQDNAIVYETGEQDGPEDRWFAAMAEDMNAILDAAGVPFCKGGVMAKNAIWRMSRARWERTIDGWVGRQRPQDLLNVDIFFDAVPVHGAGHLGEAIVAHAWERGRAARDFVKLLTELARDWRSPFTLLGSLRSDGERRVDAKKYGLMPLFTAARVLAIRHGIGAHSTPDRLAGLAAKGAASAEDIDRVIEAHRTILGAVLAQQLSDIERGIPPSPRIAWGRLDKPALASLRKALGDVGTAIDLVAEGRL